MTPTRSANCGGALQASYDIQRHRNFCHSFRHDHCKHFQKIKYLLRSEVSWCDQTRVDIELHWSTSLVSRILVQKEPAISEVRVHGCTKFGYAGRWSIAKCRFSTKGSFDHHGKAEKGNVKMKFWKMKKPEHPRGSGSVRKIDEYVIDDACEDGCVKVENVKSAKTRFLNVLQGVFPNECPQGHTACTNLLCWSGEGTSTRAAGGSGAPQASYDKRRHQNCFQIRPLQAFPKK